MLCPSEWGFVSQFLFFMYLAATSAIAAVSATTLAWRCLCLWRIQTFGHKIDTGDAKISITRAVPYWLKLEILQAQQYCCLKCWRQLPAAGSELDHIRPWAVSHDSSLSNLQYLCPVCHQRKSNTQDLPHISKTKTK